MTRQVPYTLLSPWFFAVVDPGSRGQVGSCPLPKQNRTGFIASTGLGLDRALYG